MSEPFTLRKLQYKDEKAFYSAYQEFQASTDFDFVSHYIEGMDFLKLIHILEDQECGRNLPEGFVSSTFLFGFQGVKLLGRLMIRHKLNDFLRRIGGHIGYGVVPSERGKGIATKMLQSSLPIAQHLGLNKVLLTCDEGHASSQKVIEKNGGIFESTSEQGKNLPKKRLYWISI